MPERAPLLEPTSQSSISAQVPGLIACQRAEDIPELPSYAYLVLAEADVPELAAFAPSAAAID